MSKCALAGLCLVVTMQPTYHIQRVAVLESRLLGTAAVTMDEWQWGEFKQLTSDVNEVLLNPQNTNSSHLYVHAPTEADRLFLTRMRWFIKRHLSKCGKSKIFGKVCGCSTAQLCRHAYRL